MSADATKTRRRRTIAITAVYLVVATLVGGILLYATAKRPPGRDCEMDGECKSGHCIHLVTARPQQPAIIEGRVCTGPCRGDAECPSSMFCAPPDRERDPRVVLYALDLPEGGQCIPRGFERGAQTLTR